MAVQGHRRADRYDLGGSTINTAYAPSGGAFANPSGESLKLTGLAMEAGIEPKLHNRYPRD